MNLSPNFSLEELTFSPLAKRLGIINAPNPQQIESLRLLAQNILQPLRNYLGVPILISSGFRCPDLNRAAGGAADSQHLYGQAADIHTGSIGNDAIFEYIKHNLPFDQMIFEHVPLSNPRLGWVHVSYALPLRHEELSCTEAGSYRPGMHYVQ